MKLQIAVTALFFAMLLPSICNAESGFTQEDRDRLIRLEATLQTFMQQVDKRFEQMDKRIEDLREDMNKRFEQMITFLWILAGIFTALVAAVIGFAYWDRRTIIRRAKEEVMEEIKKKGF